MDQYILEIERKGIVDYVESIVPELAGLENRGLSSLVAGPEWLEIEEHWKRSQFSEVRLKLEKLLRDRRWNRAEADLAIEQNLQRMGSESEKHLADYLPPDLLKPTGRPLFDTQRFKNPGAIAALAVDREGGSGVVVLVECIAIPGSGRLELTQGGRVCPWTIESAKVAHSFLKSCAHLRGLEDLNGIDLHIDAPYLGDGPSAGVAIAAAMVSAAFDRPIKPDVAITGAISLRGKVLSVGGVKEKILAAYNAGFKTVIIPEVNSAAVDSIPNAIKKNVDIIKVEGVIEAVFLALTEKVEDDSKVSKY